VKLTWHHKILHDNIHSKLIIDQMPTQEWVKLMWHCKILHDNIHGRLVTDQMGSSKYLWRLVRKVMENVLGITL
jgi:hypothetical protein